jgi:hypothetical protein
MQKIPTSYQAYVPRYTPRDSFVKAHKVNPLNISPLTSIKHYLRHIKKWLILLTRTKHPKEKPLRLQGLSLDWCLGRPSITR